MFLRRARAPWRCRLGWHRWWMLVLDPGQPPYVSWLWQCDRCGGWDLP